MENKYCPHCFSDRLYGVNSNSMNDLYECRSCERISGLRYLLTIKDVREKKIEKIIK